MSEKDKKICELLRSHDEEGIALLFDVYFKSLVSWANLFLNDLALSEDVVQEMFVDLWNQKISKQLRPDTLSSFLRVSVKNRSLNRIVKKDVFTRFVGVDYIDCVFEEYDNSKDLLIAKVLEEVTLLPPRSRDILNCVFVEGMKYHEVADRYGISLSTVKTLLGLGIRKLREKLGKEDFFQLLFLFCSSMEKCE